MFLAFFIAVSFYSECDWAELNCFFRSVYVELSANHSIISLATFSPASYRYEKAKRVNH